MKRVFLLLLVSFSTLLACTGDCLSCHPKLVPTINDDARHKPMLTCITCHKPDANSMADCGSDCFACHPVSKITQVGVKEHDVIITCRNCHMEIEKSLQLDLPAQQSEKETLKEFLLP